MNKLFVFFIALFIIQICPVSIRSADVERCYITELMRDPFGSENAMPGGRSHEYIEILNAGTTDLNLDTLFLTTGTDVDSVKAWSVPLASHPHCRYGVNRLKPGEVALLLDPDYAAAVLADPSSRLPIPDSTIILTIDDNDFGDGSGLAFDDGIFFFKGTRTSIGRIITSAVDSGLVCAVGGVKVKLKSGLLVPEGTSVIASRVIGALPSYRRCPARISPGTVEIVENGWIVEWKNLGVNSAADSIVGMVNLLKIGPGNLASVLCRVDRGNRSTDTIPAIRAVSADSGVIHLFVRLPIDTIPSTIRVVDGSVRISRLIDISDVWTPPGAVQITEIHPRATSAEPEWIEIGNHGGMMVDLRGWRVGDHESSDTLAGESVLLPSGGFVVFTADSALFRRTWPVVKALYQPRQWHSLDNYHDTLILRNGSGIVVDSAIWDYTRIPGWNDQSIERPAGAASTTWVLAARSSPGQPGNHTALAVGAGPLMDIGPLPFTPDGDGIDDYLSITTSLPAGSTITLDIYGFDGSLLRKFDGPFLPQILWDGRQSDGRPAPVGPFFVTGVIAGSSGKSVIRKKGVLWR